MSFTVVPPDFSPCYLLPVLCLLCLDFCISFRRAIAKNVSEDLICISVGSVVLGELVQQVLMAKGARRKDVSHQWPSRADVR